MINIKDIAKLAGVSYSTVSKALNGSSLVKPATKSKILEIAEKYGYQKNLLATQLVSGRSRLVGFVVDNVRNPIFAHMANDLHLELQNHDYHMLLAISPDGVELLNQLRVEGIIIWGDLIHSDPDFLKRFHDLNVPGFILGTDEVLRIPHILIDRKACIHEAVRYLIAHGHRKIGFVGGSQEIKVNAFREAISEMGLETSEDWLIPADSTWEGGYRVIRDYAFHKESPTAFIGLNNLITKGVLRALLERGFSVPADISLVGYDNLPELKNAEVPLTTVGPSLEEMVSKSVSLLQTLIERPGNALPVVLKPALVERASVGPRR